MFDYRYSFDVRMLVSVFNLSLLHPVTERQETDTGIKKTEGKKEKIKAF